MRASYTPDYYVGLPEKHPFPMGKFPALHQQLLAEGLLRPEDVIKPGEATWQDLRLVHTEGYLDRLANSTLGPKAERRMGLPWSAALVRRSRLAVQGTLTAARMALKDGLAANLAGGTHHAFADFGEGFCVLNDIAVAIRVLVAEQRIKRALVIDLDVHQGNGTAAILASDTNAYTFSMHGAKNFPFKKETSSLDVELPDGMEDTAYLQTLATHLPTVFNAARPDLVFYLAGVDPVVGDRYGRLALSREGLRQREAMVLEALRVAGMPLVLLLSGGYAPTPEATAALHVIVHREASRVFKK
jgi:acetoin utilization deacetylase AcuC-like enzyme